MIKTHMEKDAYKEEKEYSQKIWASEFRMLDFYKRLNRYDTGNDFILTIK